MFKRVQCDKEHASFPNSWGLLGLLIFLSLSPLTILTLHITWALCHAHRSANALLEIPQASGVLAAGSLVPALLIEDLQGMPEPHAVASENLAWFEAVTDMKQWLAVNEALPCVFWRVISSEELQVKKKKPHHYGLYLKHERFPFLLVVWGCLLNTKLGMCWFLTPFLLVLALA